MPKCLEKSISLWASVSEQPKLVWDATCSDTYAFLHVSVSAREVGAMAAKAEHLKSAKYATLKVSHHFVPFAVESSCVLGQINF